MEMKSLAKKTITCFVAALSLIAILFNVFNTGAYIPWYPGVLTFYTAGILLIFAPVWAIIWHYKQSKGTIHSQKHFAVLYTIIRYTLAFNISVFGWSKLLQLQFRVPEAIASGPMNQQPGEWLTWYYFGYSYSFILILAFVQIVGATLLLFRKTLLLGTIILFALMLNITLINICYSMNLGALLMSVLITIGITFLILVHYKKLIMFFFPSHSNGVSTSRLHYVLRSVLWLSAIILSLLFVLYMKSTV